jgi:hypothetical protein
MHGVRCLKKWLLEYLLFLTMCSNHVAFATTDASGAFCQRYPKALGCTSTSAACAICHAGPPSLNSYGQDLGDHLTGALAVGLLEAVQKIEKLDSDGDGSTNIDEISNRGAPGNPNVKPSSELALVYDPSLAYKRVVATYCGTTASYEEIKKIQAAADSRTLIKAKLTECLGSNYWTKEALYRLADKKIQPLAAVGFGGNVVIGDYRWDYRLFSHIMTGDRDARELLSATYHIDANGNKVEGVVAREEPFELGQRIVIAGGEPLQPDRRAGMITTQWFLSFYTMFSQLPRNTASQVYRAYLGLDLAKGEGLQPVMGEPRDVDNRRVAQSECAVCHSTLDPLAYAFSTYKGIEISAALAFGNPIGTYDAQRAPWEAQGQIFGKPVDNLLEWADLARNSDDFKKNIARMMFEKAMSRDPAPHELAEFDQLWRNLPADGYSVNKLIHRFVETKAFGGRKP